MAKLPGAKETMVRAGAMVVIILGVLTQIVFYGIKAPDSALMIIIPIIGVLGFVFLQKFDLIIKKEFDFLEDNPILAWSIWVSICTVVQIVLGYIIAENKVDVWSFYIPLLLSMFVLTYAWHYCLSIYKDEKKQYYIALSIGTVLWLLFGFLFMSIAFAIVPPIIILLAADVNFFLERRLIKKKLLNFI